MWLKFPGQYHQAQLGGGTYIDPKIFNDQPQVLFKDGQQNDNANWLEYV